jgi:hypothetical protein
MTAPTPYAPGAQDPTSAKGAGAAASGDAGSSSPARPAQSFPTASAARALLVRRAMAEHSTLALDGIDMLLDAGHTDAALIQLEGLREAEKLLAARIASTIRTLLTGSAG